MASSPPRTLSWEEARRLFPVTERWAYLDHACVSPISEPVHQAMTAHLADVLTDGAVQSDRWDRMVEQARRVGSALLGCQPQEVAFLKNTSEGISLVAAGLDWRPGDNIVSAQGEFPANVYPWMALAQRGVELRLVAESDGRIRYRDIRDAVDGRTRVLALSFVEFLSGFRHNVARLGELCRRRGVLFALDAIQGLGALPLNVRDAGVHFASADAHKWLLGPEGSALFFCRRECLGLVGAPLVGWRSVANSGAYLPYHFTLRPDAARFELGTTNTVGIAGLAAAAKLLLSVGLPTVESRIKLLTDRLCRGLVPLSAEVLSSRRAGEWSGIVSFRLPGSDLKAVARRLRQQGIVLSYRLGWLRASPHFYNTEAEVDGLLQALRRA